MGQNVLSGTNINLWVCWLCPTYLEPDLKAKLPPCVQFVLTPQLDLFALPSCLKTYMQVNEFEGGEVLQVSTSLVVFGDRFGD